MAGGDGDDGSCGGACCQKNFARSKMGFCIVGVV